MMERRYGSFQRSMRLPDTVDQDKVEASFNNGVLKVSLPKHPEAVGKQRRIPITKRKRAKLKVFDGQSCPHWAYDLVAQREHAWTKSGEASMPVSERDNWFHPRSAGTW